MSNQLDPVDLDALRERMKADGYVVQPDPQSVVGEIQEKIQFTNAYWFRKRPGIGDLYEISFMDYHGTLKTWDRDAWREGLLNIDQRMAYHSHTSPIWDRRFGARYIKVMFRIMDSPSDDD